MLYSDMWHLRATEVSGGAFRSIGNFETAGAAARRILEIEESAAKSLFFEVQLGILHETDHSAFGFLTYEAKSGRQYIVQRREQ